MGKAGRSRPHRRPFGRCAAPTVPSLDPATARLSAAAIGDRIKVLAANAGIKKLAAITAQGVRAGTVTDLTVAGVSGKRLAGAGRWCERSSVLERVYVRLLQDGEDNPFDRISAAHPLRPF